MNKEENKYEIKNLGGNPVVEQIKLLSNNFGKFGYLNYFGEFLLFVDIKVNNRIPTAGVTVTKTNPLLVYNEKFVKSLNQYSLTFLLIHEVFHLLSGHNQRIIDNNLEPKLGNIAADIVINESIINTIIDDDFIKEAPLIKSTLRKPEKYSGSMVLENVYMWIKKQQKEYDKTMDSLMEINGEGDSSENSEGSNNSEKNGGKSESKDNKEEKSKNNKGDKKDPSLDGMGKEEKEKREKLANKIGQDMVNVFDRMKEQGKDGQMTLDKHFNIKIPEGLKNEIISSIEQNLKNRGLETSNIASSLRALKKSKKDYTKEILSTLEKGFGIKNTKSFRRPNRRGIPGLKGSDSEFKSINVMLDISGSMNNYFEKALSFIFRNGININLIQCDTEVHDEMEINSLSDFKKVVINGLGGTRLQPGIDYIEANKKIKTNNLLILTDGYTDTLSFNKIRKVLILSNSTKCNIDSSPRTKVKQIIIKNFEE